MKAVVAAFNQEKALVGAFSVISNLRMELFGALVPNVLFVEAHAVLLAERHVLRDGDGAVPRDVRTVKHLAQRWQAYLHFILYCLKNICFMQ